MRTQIGWARSLCVGACWLLCFAHGSTQAQAPLPVALVHAKQLRIDGELGDWLGTHFVRVGDDDRGRAEVALAHDTTGLYIAARVSDDVFVRTAKPTPREDALVLALALSAAGKPVLSELWLFAGKSGESRASLQLKAADTIALRELSGARIVEAPAPGGYHIEAFVPWSQLPHGNAWPFARGGFRLSDVDKPGGPARVLPPSAASSSAARLPWLVFDGGPVAALESFMSQKDLTRVTPLLDWVGDVRGDALAERVLVLGSYLVLSSAGGAFTFSDLPVANAADVRSAELIDLTGDAKPELVVRLRSRDDRTTREIWRVFDLGADPLRSVFALETQRQIGGGSLDASVSVSSPGARRPATITIRVGRARGLSASDVAPDPAPDVVPIPPPWGSWLERGYAWDGRQFALKAEHRNPAYRPAAAAGAPPTAAREPPIASAASSGTAELLRAYRAARNIPDAQLPRFSQQADLAGDARPETLAVFGRECVVVGDGFRGGQDFFYFGLPVNDASQIHSVFSGDVTGDGHKEVFARIAQQIGAVSREILFVYTFRAEQWTPLLSVEVSRSEGATHAIANDVGLVPDADHLALQIAPGTARGWTRAEYPFSAESQDGIGPLLLPWKDKTTYYRYDGQRLIPRLRSE